MRAIVYTGPKQLELLDVDDPEAAAGELLLDVRCVGICGSELEGVATESPFRVPPLIMGHEFVGTRVDNGDRVAVNPLASCLECDLCLAGRGNLCRRRQLLGVHRAGGFAQRVAVPARNVHPLPDEVGWAAGALAEPLANAIHAWTLAAPEPGSRVGIVGAGTVGLTVLLAALRYGGGAVDIADRSAERRRAAERVGTANVVTELGGEYDVVFDAVGSPGTRVAAMDALAPGGTAVWIGLHDEQPGFDARAAIRTEKRVQCSFAYTDRDFRAAMELLPSVDPFWVTPAGLDDGVRLFLELMNGRTDLVKVQLEP